MYMVAAEELQEELNGLGLNQYRNVLAKIARGYQQLIYSMLKFGTTFFDQKSIYLDENELVIRNLH